MYVITVAVAVCAGLVFGHASPPPADGGSGSCQAKMTAFPFEPSSKCCTSAEQGVHVAGINQHPWAALIDYEKKKGNTRLLCAGTLISGKYVLTAAQCIVGQVLDIATPIAVRLGEFDSSHEGRDCVPVDGGEDCDAGPTTIAIETTIPHPKYESGHPSKWNDIGLIRLKEVAPYTDFIRPICLPTKNLESNPPDHPLYAVTWFNPKNNNQKIKTLIKAPFVDQEKCKPIYSKPGRVIAFGQGQLCAGGIEGMDTCRGDGGGPLVDENQGISELIGIVSFGVVPCGQKDIPSVYTNVYEYLDWIKTIIVATKVRLGEYNITHEGMDCVTAAGGGEDCTDGVTRIAIERTIPHPDYKPGTSKANDIGLIRLKETAPYTDFIRPVCLPTKDLTRPENTPPYFSLIAVGWGATEKQEAHSEVKLYVKVPFVNQEKCQPIYNTAGRSVSLRRSQLCAGGIEHQDTCKGDSGGPLVYENQSKFGLIGIVSFGPSPCGQKGVPGIYSNVYEYLDWIKSVIVP